MVSGESEFIDALDAFVFGEIFIICSVLEGLGVACVIGLASVGEFEGGLCFCDTLGDAVVDILEFDGVWPFGFRDIKLCGLQGIECGPYGIGFTGF